MRPEHMKCHVYGQSRVQQLYGKAKNHHQKTVTKGVNIGIPKKTEGSTTPSPQDGAWTQSDAKFFVSKTEPDDTPKYGSASRPRRRLRTNLSTSAHRQSEKHFGAVPGSQTLAGRVVQLQFKRTTTLPSLSINPGTLSRWARHEKPVRNNFDTKGDVGRGKQSTLLRGRLDTMAQIFIQSLWGSFLFQLRSAYVTPERPQAALPGREV